MKMSYDNVASVIFSHPPIGFIGLDEDAAKAKFGAENIKCHSSKFINMYYSPAMSMERKQSSIFKLICHVQPDGQEKVVGIHACGKGVDEMMQGLSVAMNMGVTKQDFDNSVAIHPTGSEEWVTMDANLIM